MRVLVFALLATVAAAARLENTYLPPNSAQSAGGSGSFLRTPFGAQPSAPRFGGASPSSFSAPSSAYGAPARSFGPSGQNIAILRFNNENNGDGSYRFEYETENRISQAETGEQRNAGTDQASSVVQGTYSYAGDDGNTYTVNYVADENGFRPEGAHLPTPPPIPAAIQRSLEINAAAEAAGARYDDSGYSAGEGARYRGGSAGQFGAAAPAAQYGAPARSSGAFNPQTGYTY